MTLGLVQRANVVEREKRPARPQGLDQGRLARLPRAGIDLVQVEAMLRSLQGVLEVHHLHVWGMSTSQNAMTAHLQRRPGSIDDMALLHEAKQKLAELGIAHSTIQLEPPDHG
jgi:cobalt-zinc-cadmium efflux system protein